MKTLYALVTALVLSLPAVGQQPVIIQPAPIVVQPPPVIGYYTPPQPAGVWIPYHRRTLVGDLLFGPVWVWQPMPQQQQQPQQQFQQAPPPTRSEVQ